MDGCAPHRQLFPRRRSGRGEGGGSACDPMRKRAINIAHNDAECARNLQDNVFTKDSSTILLHAAADHPYASAQFSFNLSIDFSPACLAMFGAFDFGFKKQIFNLGRRTPFVPSRDDEIVKKVSLQLTDCGTKFEQDGGIMTSSSYNGQLKTKYEHLLRYCGCYNSTPLSQALDAFEPMF